MVFSLAPGARGRRYVPRLRTRLSVAQALSFLLEDKARRDPLAARGHVAVDALDGRRGPFLGALLGARRQLGTQGALAGADGPVVPFATDRRELGVLLVEGSGEDAADANVAPWFSTRAEGALCGEMLVCADGARLGAFRVW